MSNDWFRSWHGAPTDHKWSLIAKRAGVKPIHVSGTWWALLDHASQHADRGTVDDFDVETFALFAGMEETHVSRIVTTLAEKGLIVDGRIAQWGKRQPKREDETAGARKARSRAKNGGKPPSGGGADKPEAPLNGSGHAMSHNVTLDTDKIREESSVANATDASVVVRPKASDFCKAVFDGAVALLVTDERNEQKARSLVGRMRKTIGDADLLILLREAEEKSHPAEWLMAALETRNGNRKSRSFQTHQSSAAVAFLRHADAELAAGFPDDEALGFGTWPAISAH